MACSDLVPTRPSDMLSYLAHLDHLPEDYVDAWSGVKIDFQWGVNAGQYADLPLNGSIPGYRVTNTMGKDVYPILRAALILDCERWSDPLLAPAPPLPEPSVVTSGGVLTITPAMDTGSTPLPPKRVPAVISPTPSLAPSIQETVVPFTGTFPNIAPAQEATVPLTATETRLVAPTTVPVTRSYSTLGVAQPSAGILEGILGGVGGLITGGPMGAITGALTGLGIGGGETTTSPGTQPTGYGTTHIAGMQCPTGYQWNGQQCIATGIGGAIQRILPGGETGTLGTGGQGTYGSAVMGAFGVPALQPAQVGTINGGPIFRCPAGAVLGKDNLCYQKGTITNKQRKWPKGPRPLLTGGEMKTLRKVKTLENKVKRAWAAAGRPGQRKCSPSRRK